MKLTRRQMVVAATAGSVAAANAVAQSTPAAAAVPDFEKQARDNVKNNADALAKFTLPMSTEPAFQFKV